MLNITWSECRADDGKNSDCKRIVLAGDWVPVWDVKRGSKYDRIMAEQPAECYGATLDVLRNADLRVVNLECPINGEKPVIKSGPHLCAYDRHMPCLEAGGFDAVTLANNHVFDYGAEGFRTTCRMLDKLGIGYFGAGMDDREAWKPLVCDADGLKIGFIGFTEGHDLTAAAPGKPGVAGWDVARARAEIRELKQRCDLVIVVPHGGIEFAAYPGQYCIDAYRELAEERPAAIVAHHPHVPQGIEIYNGVPIFYSLGNFLFHHGVTLHYRRHGMLVELEADREGVHGFRIHPYFISPDGLELLEGKKRAAFGEMLHTVSRPFAPGEDPYSGFYGTLKLRWHEYRFSQFKTVIPYFESDPVKAASMLRSRLTTLQNTGLNIPTFDRVAKGIIEDAPDWAVEMEREFMTREL